ncbi:MAG: dipeptidase [Spirochaetaceae bacterium]|jgi:membrane dipeptidase|nr:dipeptidase [Spirochaetaceae bacterium]
MRFIDMHCDTLMLSFIKKLDDIYEIPEAMLDIKRMEAAGAMAQFFAVFMPPRNETLDDVAYIEHCVGTFNTTMARHRDSIVPAGSGSDVEQNLDAGRMSAFLSFEDGRPIDGRLENLDRYYGRGFRLITLTWNGENCFGFPNSRDPDVMGRGLKPFGKDAVRRMNELGMVVDVSHLSDGGFWDVAEISRKPFVASHSNCRALSPHPRNLTDDMIRTLADKGGVAGLNFAPEFLNAGAEGGESTAELISAHARRMIDVGGSECVALGSDFDGTGGNMEIDRVEKMPLLFDRLRRDGLNIEVIEKIAWKNALRVLKDVMG